MKCAVHPHVETALRCGKCGKPICPKCMVQTPVGARCRQCAKLHKLPTYQVSVPHYLRAAGTAIGIAIVGGVIWWLVEGFLPFFLGLIIAPAIGYGIGELVSLSANRKRGRGLAIIAGIGVGISYLVTILAGSIPFGLLNIGLDLLALALGVYVAVIRLH